MNKNFIEFGAIECESCETCTACSCGSEDILAMSKEKCTNCNCKKEE